MGYAGFHNGKIIGNAVVEKDKVVPNSLLFYPEDLKRQGSTLLVAENYSGALSSFVSGVESIAFNHNLTGADYAELKYVIPSAVPKDYRTKVNLYWTSSGGTSLAATGGVVWDLDYRVLSMTTSGATRVTGQQYTISGSALSNATTTGNKIVGSLYAQKNTVSIPNTATVPGALVFARLYRDGAETADNHPSPAHLLAIEVDFVE